MCPSPAERSRGTVHLTPPPEDVDRGAICRSVGTKISRAPIGARGRGGYGRRATVDPPPRSRPRHGRRRLPGATAVGVGNHRCTSPCPRSRGVDGLGQPCRQKTTHPSAAPRGAVYRRDGDGPGVGVTRLCAFRNSTCLLRPLPFASEKIKNRFVPGFPSSAEHRAFTRSFDSMLLFLTL